MDKNTNQLYLNYTVDIFPKQSISGNSFLNICQAFTDTIWTQKDIWMHKILNND